MWIWAVMLEWGIIGICLYLASISIYLWPLAIFIIGTRQHGIAILGHDGAHRLICKNRKLNDILCQVLCFLPLSIGLTGYRKFHFEHHRTVGTERDPELSLINGWSKKQWELPITKAKVIKYIILDLLGFYSLEIVKVLLLIKKVTFLDYLIPVVSVSIFASLIYFYPFFIVWYLALFTSFWCAFRLRALTEHVGANSTHIIKPVWWQRWWFLPWNTWCHYEHHDNPNISFSKLPQTRTKKTITVKDLLK